MHVKWFCKAMQTSDCQIASCVMFDAPMLLLDSATVLVFS